MRADGSDILLRTACFVVLTALALTEQFEQLPAAVVAFAAAFLIATGPRPDAGDPTGRPDRHP
jgi:hypothetical protein